MTQKITANFSWKEFGPNKSRGPKEKFPTDLILRDNQGKTFRRCNVQENIEFLAQQLEIIRSASSLLASQLEGRETPTPITIYSGFRTQDYNKQSKGRASKSFHLSGQAVDIKVNRLALRYTYHLIDYLMREDLICPGGLAHYPTFVHYDTRGYKARWRKAPDLNPHVAKVLEERVEELREISRIFSQNV